MQLSQEQIQELVAVYQKHVKLCVNSERMNMKKMKDRFLRELTKKALEISNGKKANAARILGLKRTTFLYLLDELEKTRPQTQVPLVRQS